MRDRNVYFLPSNLSWSQRQCIWVLLLTLATGYGPFARGAPALKKSDVLTWPKATSSQFGCFLERELNHKDHRFNCALRQYKNNGDPHKNTTVYYEGPKFPQGKVVEVSPHISSIDLSWEHGDLQLVSIKLKKKMTKKEVIRAFGLPRKELSPRVNVLSYSIQQCSTKATCLLLLGFDHVGAGD